MSNAKWTIQALCYEAVAICGPDWPEIERYVAARLVEMDEQSREGLKRDMARLLGFQAPTAPPRDLH